jgi:hypothetical protein
MEAGVGTHPSADILRAFGLGQRDQAGLMP